MFFCLLTGNKAGKSVFVCCCEYNSIERENLMSREIKGMIVRIVSFNWEEKMVSNAFVEKVALTRSNNGSFRVTRMKGVGGQVWSWGSVGLHAFNCSSYSCM